MHRIIIKVPIAASGVTSVALKEGSEVVGVGGGLSVALPELWVYSFTDPLVPTQDRSFLAIDTDVALPDGSYSYVGSVSISPVAETHVFEVIG